MFCREDDSKLLVSVCFETQKGVFCTCVAPLVVYVVVLTGVKYGGENALEFKKWSFYRQIIKNVAESQTFHPDLIFYSFTLLRLDEELVKKVNLENLRSFVQRMSCCD